MSAPTPSELVERVRDLLNDYGDIDQLIATQLAAAVTTTAQTTFSVDSAADFDAGDWGYIDFEVIEVTATNVAATPDTLTVRRGARGSTAATHLNGAVIRANERFSSATILRGLNAALAGAYPMIFKVTEDTTLATVADQEHYTLAAPHRDLRSLWIEANAGQADYQLCRSYKVVDSQDFVLYGGWLTGYTIKVICIDQFTALTSAGTLDAVFPDNEEAYEYLVMDTAGRLLHRMAAQEAVNNSADARGQQTAESRYVILNAAKDLRAEAQKALVKARMQKPSRISPRPDAAYF